MGFINYHIYIYGHTYIHTYVRTHALYLCMDVCVSIYYSIQKEKKEKNSCSFSRPGMPQESFDGDNLLQRIGSRGMTSNFCLHSCCINTEYIS